jgi:hypothetical protein
MGHEAQENQDKSTTEGVFLLLSDSQWRFVTTMIANPDMSKAEAARAIDLKPQTIYAWPEHVDEAIKIARRDIHEATKEARRQALLEAMRVKVGGLRSKDEAIAQRAATEIIEWELGKAVQVQEMTGKDGSAIRFEWVDPVSRDDNIGIGADELPDS